MGFNSGFKGLKIVQLSVWNNPKNDSLDSHRIRNIEMTGPTIGLFPLTGMEMKIFLCLHERQHVTF